MIARSGNYAVLAVVFSLFLSLEGREAQAQGGYELRCRGRGGAFAIDRIDASTVSLRFTASPRAAGADGAGLDPGTCAWIDRAVNSAEPLLIRFQADAVRATLIAQQLSDPNSFWSFVVNNTNQGYFAATSNNSWAQSQTSKADITPRTNNPDITGRAVPRTNADITSRGSVMAPPGRQAIDRNLLKGEDVRAPAITDITAVPTAQNVTISFTTFPNTIPLVEVANLPPVKGATGRWGFPTTRPAGAIEQAFGRTGPTVPFASGVVTRAASGDKANGKYTVDMNQELDPGVTYYYIINVKSGNDPGAEIRQATGRFRMPGSNSYQVRYRGFFADETTTGPGSDEIYAIVSISYVNPSGAAATSSGIHPGAIATEVTSEEAYGDPGRMIYEGRPVDLLVTVTVMEHDSGDPNRYKTSVQGALVSAIGAIILNPSNVESAVNLVSNAVSGALGAGDDVIGTTSRLITAAEMKFIANNGAPKPSEHGITHDFFTEHRGHGAIYRVYFDIIPQ